MKKEKIISDAFDSLDETLENLESKVVHFMNDIGTSPSDKTVLIQLRDQVISLIALCRKWFYE